MLLHEVPEIKPGYVEALHAKFEEEVDQNDINQQPISDHHYETYTYALSQLPGPDNTIGSGFQDTAEWIFGDRIPPKAASHIYEAGWSLYRLLTATNEDLRNIGIIFESDRAKILNSVRAFHLAPWRTMKTISLTSQKTNKKHKEEILFLLETFSRLTQQLYIDAATISWLRQRIPKKANDREHLRILVKEAMTAIKMFIKLTEEIHNYIKEVNKELPHLPVDYIGSVDKKSYPLYKRIIVSSVFLVSVALLFPVVEDKLSQTIFSPLLKLPLKWCVVLGWLCV